MRYPGARWMPFPENATQPGIRPTQVIHHVTASSGPISGTWKYFDLETTVVESHFGVDYDAEAWQGIDDEIRADANYRANKRPNGTGAISVETRGTEMELWTPAQIDWLVDHGIWCHQNHDIPLRICRTPDDPGYGYHTLFGAPSDWTPVSKTCPGPNRIVQWKEIVFPRIEAEDWSMDRETFAAYLKATPINNLVTEDVPDDNVSLGGLLSRMRKQIWDLATAPRPTVTLSETDKADIINGVIAGLTGGAELQFVPKD